MNELSIKQKERKTQIKMKTQHVVTNTRRYGTSFDFKNNRYTLSVELSEREVTFKCRREGEMPVREKAKGNESIVVLIVFPSEIDFLVH